MIWPMAGIFFFSSAVGYLVWCITDTHDTVKKIEKWTQSVTRQEEE